RRAKRGGSTSARPFPTRALGRGGAWRSIRPAIGLMRRSLRRSCTWAAPRLGAVSAANPASRDADDEPSEGRLPPTLSLHRRGGDGLLPRRRRVAPSQGW